MIGSTFSSSSSTSSAAAATASTAPSSSSTSAAQHADDQEELETDFGVGANIARRGRLSIGGHLEKMQKKGRLRPGTEYLIAPEQLELSALLGHGETTSVFRGMYAGSPVAIKEYVFESQQQAAGSSGGGGVQDRETAERLRKFFLEF